MILDIFAGHAHTAEGKLQVELAQLEYNLARMRGLWTHLERSARARRRHRHPRPGRVADRDGPPPGARPHLRAAPPAARTSSATRATQRAERERAHLPTVALAGYTNAGKSTLLNALTGAEVGVRDRLFHTLDPTTRTLRLDGRTYLMTDTVGFIRKLPHQLVDAFGATLEETQARRPAPARRRRQRRRRRSCVAMLRAVEDVLEEIGAGEQPRLLVLNKADAIDDERRRELAFRHPEAVLVSALTGEGLDELGERIAAEFERTLRDVELLVPFSEGGTLSELHELAGDLEREDTAGGRARRRAPARRGRRALRALRGQRQRPARVLAGRSADEARQRRPLAAEERRPLDGPAARAAGDDLERVAAAREVERLHAEREAGLLRRLDRLRRRA